MFGVGGHFNRQRLRQTIVITYTFVMFPSRYVDTTASSPQVALVIPPGTETYLVEIFGSRGCPSAVRLALCVWSICCHYRLSTASPFISWQILFFELTTQCSKGDFRHVWWSKSGHSSQVPNGSSTSSRPLLTSDVQDVITFPDELCAASFCIISPDTGLNWLFCCNVGYASL